MWSGMITKSSRLMPGYRCGSAFQFSINMVWISGFSRRGLRSCRHMVTK